MKRKPSTGVRDLPGLARAVRDRLLPWFDANNRDLPWRRNRTPYRVLVSELMLQQTRVEQAMPFYRRFLRRFPSMRALSRASLDDVLKAWEGLGYYARARHLHRLAVTVCRESGGRLPDTLAGLLELPGLGPYTAAAVASLAFGRDVAAVDGNVLRVLCRLRTRSRMSPEEGRALAAALLPPGRAGAFNEATMELGATVCLPRRPRCDACPLREVCRGGASGRPERWPAARRRRRVPHLVVGAAVTLNRRGEILIARRREDDMLGGLWEFPGGKREAGETMEQCIRREMREEMALEVEVGLPLTVVRHAYSHFTIELHAYFARIRRGRPHCRHCAGYAWVRPAEFDRYPFSRADLRIIEALRNTFQASYSEPQCPVQPRK